MAGTKYFSTIDLIRRYYQIKIDNRSIEKTAFSTPFSHYEFVRMPFGVKGGPATFQRGMMLALAGIPWSEVMAYLDDIIIRSDSFQQHLVVLEKVLCALERNGFKLKPSKTYLCRESVNFLGHIINSNGIMPLPKNLSGVMEFPIPSSVKQLRQLLGMVNFYRRHIPNCSTISKPLSQQTGGKYVTWNQECQIAFETLKKALVDPKLLAFPDYSNEASPLELDVDASGIGAGAVLSQKQKGHNRPICFMSMTFSRAQQRYSTIERELAALRWAVKTLRPFLCNSKFIIFTDHQPLVYLQNMSASDSRIARTLEELSEFNFEIKHISGIRNVVADVLSRSPVPCSENENSDELNYGDNNNNFTPPGFEEIVVPGGGDSLFRCFSLWETGSQESHVDVRTRTLDEIIKNPVKYHLKGRNTNKLLKAMRSPGHMPIVEVITAFAKLNKISVVVYYNNLQPIKYGDDCQNSLFLKCLAGIHYNLLRPLEKSEKIVEVNLIRIHNLNVEHCIINNFKHSDLDLDIITMVQNRDKVTSKVKQLLKNKIHSKNWPYFVKLFTTHSEKLVVENNVLYYFKNHNLPLVVVPFDFLITVVLKLHLSFAHIGRNKLIDLVYKELWNPRVNQVVSDVCRSCPVCQQNKVFSNCISPPILKISSSFPFDLCAVDLLKLPVTPRGHQYCLVFIDHFSKFVVIVPLTNKYGKSIVNAFQFRIFPFLLRIPNRILSDNGSEFINSEIRELLSTLGINHVIISPYMASCNGI